MKKLLGSCYCQANSFSFSANPIANFICHCTKCRKIHSAPFNHVLMFNAQDFCSDESEDKIIKINTSEMITRYSCKECGSNLFNKLSFPEGKLVSSFTSVINNLPPELKTPSEHIFYGNRICDFNDGIIKYKDMRKEFGGSGEIID